MHPAHMKKSRPQRPTRPQKPGRPYTRTFLREWREYRNLTLERAADRIGEVTGEGLSHGQLSRIERGEQPYSQAILEAAADAYGTDPASLLMRNPIDPEGIWSVWDQAKTGEQRRIILDLAKTVLKTGT